MAAFKNGEFVKWFPSAQAGADWAGALKENICHVCKGRRNRAGGFEWGYMRIKP